MKLYLVHCGYYDSEVADGIYESHVNFFIVAENFDDAKIVAKKNPEFQRKRMHIDGLQEISAVQGFAVLLQEKVDLQGQTLLINNKHRELAPPRPSTYV